MSLLRKVEELYHMHDIAMPSAGERGEPPAYLHQQFAAHAEFEENIWFHKDP